MSRPRKIEVQILIVLTSIDARLAQLQDSGVRLPLSATADGPEKGGGPWDEREHRPAVLVLAARWQAAGASLVAISEASALPLPGWHAHELGGPSGFGRTWSKQRREVLTLSRPPAGQMALCG